MNPFEDGMRGGRVGVGGDGRGLNKDLPLCRFAPSPSSRFAALRGEGDDTLTAGRPLLGVPWPGPRQSDAQLPEFD